MKEEKNFELRAYDKVELALLYCPGRSEETAMKTLTRWINQCSPLVQALAASGGGTDSQVSGGALRKTGNNGK